MYNQMEAWYALYTAWKKAKRYRLSLGWDYYYTSRATFCDGICLTLADFKDQGKIDEKIYWRMKSKINKERNKYSEYRNYIWPRDREGKEARAAFCLRQYKEMKRKR